MVLCAPRLSSARAVFSLVSPAPIIITCRARNESKIFSASSTATEPTDTLPGWTFSRVVICPVDRNEANETILKQIGIAPLGMNKQFLRGL